MRFSNVFAWLLLLCLISCVVQAQDKVVQGVVQDEKGVPLAGVTISVKGTKTFTNSDAKGNFSIKVSEKNKTLIITHVGMQEKVVQLENQVYVQVSMTPAAATMNDVVVIGYGVVKKKDLTGSVASIKGDDLLKTVPTSINGALQGQVAGVQVQRNDGAPGSGISILIRGANTFSTNTEPLFVIDGIPFTSANTPANPAAGLNGSNQTINPLSTLNPNDIESIDILKDASATAIYGSRGANGVVLVTTKKGKAGQDKVELTVNYTHAKITKKMHMLDAYTYAKFQNEAVTNRAFYEGSTNTALPYPGTKYWDPVKGDSVLQPGPDDYLNGYNGGGTDWQDVIFRGTNAMDYTLRAYGGNEKGSYSISGNYVDQPGIIIGSDYKRYAMQLNVVRKVHKWLEIGTSNNLSKTVFNLAKTNSEGTGVINSALYFPPTYPLFDSTTASGVSQVDWFAANPYIYTRTAKDQTNSNSIYSASYVQLNFTPWLNFRQNFGFNYNANARSAYYNRYTSEGKIVNGSASRGDDEWQGTTLESILSFNKQFKKHSLNAVGGFVYERGISSSKSIRAQNFANDILQDFNLASALDPYVITSGQQAWSLASFLGRVNYSYNDRYLLTASIRRDGSTRFTDNRKWGNFPSFAAAWNAGNETFIKNLNVFSTLKLRASWGQTGNQSIPAYTTQAMLNPANVVINGQKQSGFAGVSWRGPADPNLKWETTTQEDLGLDIGFFKNRLSFTVDYYHKKTTDLLQLLLIPSSTGYNNKYVNYGYVLNHGMEFSVLATPIDNKNFNWNLNANVSFNKNKIEGLESDQFQRRLWSGIDNAFLLRNGYPIGTIYGMVEDGFYDNEAEVRADPAYANKGDLVIRSMIGERKYKHLGTDSTTIGNSDRTIIGNTNPKYSFGITNNFRYKKFSLSFFIQGVQGQDIVNSNLLKIAMGDIGNIPQFAYDERWTADNYANAKYPKANSSFNRNHFFSNTVIEDASYVRLKSVNLGYTFNAPWKYIESVYLYGNAGNLFTITKYSWFDPDVNSLGSGARGVDMNAYPTTRTFTLGAKVTF